MSTPLERAAEAMGRRVYGAEAPNDDRIAFLDELARAALEAAIDEEEIARIVLGYDYNELRFPDRRDEQDRDASMRRAAAIKAHLLGGAE